MYLNYHGLIKIMLLSALSQKGNLTSISKALKLQSWTKDKKKSNEQLGMNKENDRNG